MAETLISIGINELIPDPTQPRKHFAPETVERMAVSLKAQGVLAPLRVLRDKERQCYRIVVGETRWRAAKLAGLTQLPCIVIEGQPTEADLLAARLVENSCRNDLRPLELARGIATLKSLLRCPSQEVATRLGISNASVSRAEALLSLPEDVQELIDGGSLAENAGYEISRLPGAPSQREMARLIVAGRLSRDQVVEAVRKQVGKKHVQPRGGRVTGKLEGVSFTFSFASGELTPEALLRAIDQIRSKLRALQRDDKDMSALSDLLRAS